MTDTKPRSPFAVRNFRLLWVAGAGAALGYGNLLGIAVQASVDGTMFVAGVGMALLAGGSSLSAAVRNLGLEPAGASSTGVVADAPVVGA